MKKGKKPANTEIFPRKNPSSIRNEGCDIKNIWYVSLNLVTTYLVTTVKVNLVRQTFAKKFQIAMQCNGVNLIVEFWVWH